MPTLDWIGKSAVIEHHKEVPFRLLKCREDLSVGEADSGNLLIQGVILEAGEAEEAGALWWEYRTDQAAADNLRVTISAKDLPRHVTERTGLKNQG